MREGETILGYLVADDTIPAGSIVDVVMTRQGTMRARPHAVPLLDIDSMTWTCMVCGDERPDAAISVAHRFFPGLEDMFPDARTNVRYCNDRPDCVAIAVAPGPWPPAAGLRKAQVAAAAPTETTLQVCAPAPADATECDLAAGVHLDPHKNCLFS